MQLGQLEKLAKLGQSKWFAFDRVTGNRYVLSVEPFSKFDRRVFTLQHPYLLTVTEMWEERGQMCTLQKAEAITDLLQIQKSYRLSENLILQILMQISEAMEYLARNDIPTTVTLGNVYLDASSQIKIDILAIQSTPLEFASPEFLRKDQPSSGIWSLGCIAYFLAKGQMPYTADNERILAYNIIYKEPTPADFSEFPLVGTIVRAIFIKNHKKRLSFQQLNNFLLNKVSTFDLQESIKVRWEVSKKQSVYSLDLKESQIEHIEPGEQSVSLKPFLMEEGKPPIPQIITLDMLEDQMDGFVRKIKGRPQSTVIDTSKVVLQKLQRMRPNSAIAFNSGKDFIARNIKQEIHNRRIQSSQSQQISIATEAKRTQKVQKEVSIDLKDAPKVKEGDLIRVYNLEYQEDKKVVSKNTRVHMKVLAPTSPKTNTKVDSKIVKGLQDWKSKMIVNMF